MTSPSAPALPSFTHQFSSATIDELVSIMAKNDSDGHALLWAVRKDSSTLVQFLLTHGANVHAGGDQALREASHYNKTEIVALLLDHGANVHANNDEALQLASSNGCLGTVLLLLARGADVHAENEQALRWAVDFGSVPGIKALLDHNADVNAALRCNLEKVQDSVMQVLCEYGLNVNALSDAVKKVYEKVLAPFLPTAAEKTNDVKVYSTMSSTELTELTELIKEMSKCDSRGYVMEWAIEKNRIESVRYLLDHGVVASDYHLRVACGNGFTDIVRVLLDHGGHDYTVQDSWPWLCATRNRWADTTRLLLERGANVHADDDAALRWAASRGHTEMVELLLEFGADVGAKNNEALESASMNGYDQVAQLLLEHGAKFPIKPPSTTGSTAVETVN